MAITNQERVRKALDLLKQGLAPYIEREFRSTFGEAASNAEVSRILGDDRLSAGKTIPELDTSPLLKLMFDAWSSVFRKTLGPADRALVSELRDVRNKWAHEQNFSSDDAYRALDSASRLLAAITAPEADELEKMKMELLRLRFDEQVRTERRKAPRGLIETTPGNLNPWRETVTPHKDVASGNYQQAEFAADLWQVHLGEGTAEYRDPAEFFRRTYLTESLKQLLVGAVQRLAAGRGDPVVQLQTNFGGGKTHSMLALYHLLSGVTPGDLPGIDVVLAEAGVQKLPKAKRVVLVGNKISPGNPSTKPDGTVVRTLWGELAYQLGGKKAYARIAADDERATSPGDVLRELFNEYGPCVILIDEWVAYARQLHDQSDLPGGGFETQFTFAQVLTESAKLAKNCLLVISLPASDTAGSPHTQADDVEVGGIRGREALDRLRNVVGRVESSWRPATAEEGFEIVRRRLFEPLSDPELFKLRDVTARAFADLYRTQHQEFPPECRDPDYEKRMKAAFPIHPEVFDRLYTDWSTLVKFQRTRGVLRLMAAVIHSLWEKGDRSPLILPSMIPIDDQRVQFELTRYLSDQWTPVIEKDVDGPNSLPLRIDGEVPNLGKIHACRRVARTVYLGSAPTAGAAHRGLEDRRVKLGCVMPGESPAVFGDALRRLASSATYLYQDGPRVWYSTQPTVAKLADDRAEQLKRDPDKVAQEIDRRLRAELSNKDKKGDFSRVHALAASGAEVDDDMDARLVVLSIEHPYSKEPDCAALRQAKAILESKGNSPRLYRNALVFLAVDKARLQDLDEAVRRYLAWDSIVHEAETLDLGNHQRKQAETQLKSSDGVVHSRIPEAYQWLLVPEQAKPQDPVTIEAVRLTGQDGLAVRASKKLRTDDRLVINYGATVLRQQVDKIPLWRGNHVSVRQLAEDYAKYIYLPRLRHPDVLVRAVTDAVGLLTWVQEGVAYAEEYDEAAGRYRGLRAGKTVMIPDYDTSALVVKSDVAKDQLEKETQQVQQPTVGGGDSGGAVIGGGGTVVTPPKPPSGPAAPKRFYGVVTLDTNRVGRDASRIAEEIVSHLSGLVGANVKVTIEIEAEIPAGAPENVVRTVTENARTLKFDKQGFEEE
jgi:predicted AAA+ superfamily ATPase